MWRSTGCSIGEREVCAAPKGRQKLTEAEEEAQLIADVREKIADMCMWIAMDKSRKLNTVCQDAQKGICQHENFASISTLAPVTKASAVSSQATMENMR